MSLRPNSTRLIPPQPTATLSAPRTPRWTLAGDQVYPRPPKECQAGRKCVCGNGCKFRALPKLVKVTLGGMQMYPRVGQVVGRSSRHVDDEGGREEGAKNRKKRKRVGEGEGEGRRLRIKSEPVESGGDDWRELREVGSSWRDESEKRFVPGKEAPRTELKLYRNWNRAVKAEPEESEGGVGGSGGQKPVVPVRTGQTNAQQFR